jgi:hypothetical protein
MSLIKYIPLILFATYSVPDSVLAQNSDRSDSICQKFNGYWQWTSPESETFTIKIVCIDTTIYSKVKNEILYQYLIYGWHNYSKKDVVLENTISKSGSDLKDASIYGAFLDNKKISIKFHDITRERDFRINLEFIDSDMRTLKWTTSHPLERPIYPVTHPKIWEGQTIPSEIILHKICTY